MATFEHALHYAKAGMSVIPACSVNVPGHSEQICGRNLGKHPLLGSWTEFQKRRATEEELTQWLEKWPGANIIVICGQVSDNRIVIDVEWDKLDVFNAWVKEKELWLPTTFWYTTGGGGRHAHYRTSVPVRKKKFAWGEIQGEGTYVIVPPSIHRTGNIYGPAQEKIEITPAPFALEALLLEPHVKERKTLSKDPPWVTEPLRGVAKGERNDTCTRLAGYFIGKGLPFDVVLQILLIWNERNSPPLPEREVEQTVRSVWGTHQRKHPEREGADKPLELQSLQEAFSEPEEEVVWLVEGLLPKDALSGLYSKPKVGKSTLARNLALSVAKGELFLGKITLQGPVFYLSFEERKQAIVRHFREMGANGKEPLYIYAARAPKKLIEKVLPHIREKKPVLIILDTLFRAVPVKDVDAYAEVTEAFNSLLEIAHEMGSHVMILHHLGKRAEGGDGVLGSTANFGSVDVAVFLKKTEKYRTISVEGRYGETEETVLRFDLDTRTVALGGTKEQEGIAEAEKAILEFLSSQADPVIEEKIQETVEGKKQLKVRALRNLRDQGKVSRTGGGKRGDPYLYSLASEPPEEGSKDSGILVPTIYQEPEYQKSENGKKPH